MVVDYAHTPDALAKDPASAAPHGQRNAAAQLWCVFGCGGNRDATKRPMMGAHCAAAGSRPRGADQRQPAQLEAPAMRSWLQILVGVTGQPGAM